VNTLDNGGSAWSQVGGALAQISVSGVGRVWGVNKEGGIWTRDGVTPDLPTGLAWRSIAGTPGTLKTVAVGGFPDTGEGAVDLVWGLNSGDAIFARTGIVAGTPSGTGWSQVDGGLRQISLSQTGHLWGVNSADNIWYRAGITASTPGGTSWTSISGALRCVAVGSFPRAPGATTTTDLVWGVNGAGQIFYRTGITASLPTGTDWASVDGALTQISVSASGHVWGVNSAGMVFIRDGITVSVPGGVTWRNIPSSPAVLNTIKQVANGNFVF